MRLISLNPSTATSTEEIESFTMRDPDSARGLVTFKRGDPVSMIHVPTQSIAHGVIGDFFGIGRIRGVDILGTAFGRQSFYFGQPGDEEDGWLLRDSTAKEPIEIDCDACGAKAGEPCTQPTSERPGRYPVTWFHYTRKVMAS